jgi:hypothetical protein
MLEVIRAEYVERYQIRVVFNNGEMGVATRRARTGLSVPELPARIAVIRS